jgi:endonuclease G, mitochondrial
MTQPFDEVRSSQEQQIASAARRFEETRDEREAVLATRAESGVEVHDSMDQLQARAERLVEMGETPLEAVVSIALSDIPDRKAALERIIGETNDLQSWSFLPRGARAAASVARISTLDRGRVLPLGTGFLVSSRLLMTNNHVLRDVESAANAVVEFAAEVDIENAPLVPVRYRLDPQTFFVTDPHLDVTVVLVQPDAEGRTPGERFGWNQLIRQQGKIVTGEPVNIVGHPMGRLKEISIRNNTLDLQLEDFLHYATDTEPGNSGSPVFNDQWEVVALHHSGVPKTDEQGNYLRKDGQVWRHGDGDDAICWIGNEGARVSRILTFLAGLDLDADRGRILDELGPTAEVTASSTATPVTAAAPVPAQRTTEARPTPVRKGVAGSGGEPHLVFLHGRSQQRRDPDRLRHAWTAGLNAGLTRAGLPAVDPRTVWFPYYGDRLVEVLGTRESLAAGLEATAFDTAEAVAPPPDDPARALYEELLADAAGRAGMPPELAAEEGPTATEGISDLGAGLVGRLQRQLGWLAARSGLDDLTIALLFRDVAAYLGRRPVRESVLAAVAESVPDSGPVALVSHSLGTVVAMDLIASLDRLDVTLLVTAGSPLGMDAVHGKLLDGQLGRPARVRRWVNAWCAADPVAIGCPLRPVWGDGVTDLVTDNAKARAHDIAEYLGDARVAAQVGRARAVAAVRPDRSGRSLPA